MENRLKLVMCKIYNCLRYTYICTLDIHLTLDLRFKGLLSPLRRKNTWAVHWKSELTEIEKSETGEEQIWEHAHRFLGHQGDCSQSILPGRPNSKFLIVMCRFTTTVWKCAKTSLRTLTTKELAVASRQSTVLHFLFHQGIFYQNMTVVPHPPYFLRFPDWRWKWKAAILAKFR
jgi:hypothetical protein